MFVLDNLCACVCDSVCVSACMHLYLAEQRIDLVLVLFLAMFVVDTVTHTFIIIFHTCSLQQLYGLDMCLGIRPGYETQKLAWSIDDIMSFTVATKTFHKPCSIIWLNIEWAEVTADHGNGHYMPHVLRGGGGGDVSQTSRFSLRVYKHDTVQVKDSAKSRLYTLKSNWAGEISLATCIT